MIENANGVLRIKDGNETVFDSSADELFHLLQPRIDGSISRPNASWSGSENWSTRDYDVAIDSLPAAATDIIGLARIQYSDGYSHLPSGAWYVLGGTFVLILKDFQSISGTWAAHPSSIALATIYKSGSQLRFKEQIRLKDHYMDGPGLRLGAYTMTYRLFPAVFS